MRVLTLCVHCVPFHIPDLPAETRSGFAALVRAGGPVRAMGRLTELGLTVLDAKAVAMHVTREPGRCQRCSAPLDGAYTACLRCKALNLDW